MVRCSSMSSSKSISTAPLLGPRSRLASERLPTNEQRATWRSLLRYPRQLWTEVELDEQNEKGGTTSYNAPRPVHFDAQQCTEHDCNCSSRATHVPSHLSNTGRLVGQVGHCDTMALTLDSKRVEDYVTCPSDRFTMSFKSTSTSMF